MTRTAPLARIALYAVVVLVVIGLVAWLGHDSSNEGRHFLRDLLRAIF